MMTKRRPVRAAFFICLNPPPNLSLTVKHQPQKGPVMRLSALALILSSLLAAPAAHADSMNLRFSPLSALIGVVDANFDFLVTPNLTIGPKLTYMNFKLFDVQLKGTAFGGEARYHFTRAFEDGGYANFVLSTINVEASAKSNTTGETATATGSGLNYGIGIGYHWFWESFNLNLGLVLGGTSASKIEVKDSTGTTVESASPNLATGLDFKIGFTF